MLRALYSEQLNVNNAPCVRLTKKSMKKDDESIGNMPNASPGVTPITDFKILLKYIAIGKQRVKIN